LAGVTVLVALVSEVFVESVQKAAEAFGMTMAFVGFIVAALVGGASVDCGCRPFGPVRRSRPEGLKKLGQRGFGSCFHAQKISGQEVESMSRDLKLLLEMSANATGMKRGMREAQGAVVRFSQAARNEIMALKGMFTSIHGQLAAVGLSIGAVKTIMDLAAMDKKLMQIALTAEAGADKVGRFREDLFRMGKETGQSVNSLRQGFDTLAQAGFNTRQAKACLDGVHISMAVTTARRSPCRLLRLFAVGLASLSCNIKAHTPKAARNSTPE
jgi:hypothetical protein